jgi:hypothetical protein
VPGTLFHRDVLFILALVFARTRAETQFRTKADLPGSGFALRGTQGLGLPGSNSQPDVRGKGNARLRLRLRRDK